MNKFKTLTLLIGLVSICACDNHGQTEIQEAPCDTVIVHDTVYVQRIPDGSFTYNLPCKVIGINQDKAGQSVLFLWLHGGVHDSKRHDFYGSHHLQCCTADDKIVDYLTNNGIKAIALFPVCHKANIGHCITWRECFSDVKHIIDDYINKGLIDPKRIYIAGSSDGGTGTWDYIEAHPELFAAALPLSCGRPRITSVPVYFFNTKSEYDCSQLVNTLNSQGCSIRYKYCSQYGHGKDENECTEELLSQFFGHTKSI